jgi:hypothetical protein
MVRLVLESAETWLVDWTLVAGAARCLSQTESVPSNSRYCVYNAVRHRLLSFPVDRCGLFRFQRCVEVPDLQNLSPGIAVH